VNTRILGSNKDLKVLLTGVYRDGTGWAHACIDYILALDSVGVNVVPRPIKLNELNLPIPARIRELEQQSSQGCDVIIQHILPHMMEYCGGFKKNVALFELETTSINHMMWPEHINLMDVAWLTSSHAKDTCKQSGVKIPTELVLHTTDVERYNKFYQPIEIPGTSGDFIFYTIAEFNTRKNLASLLRAFHTEFDPTEPVSLVIKSTKNGLSVQETINHLQNYCNQIKQGLNLYPKTDYYKSEVFVPNIVEDENVYRLHNSCDCFVLPSCGEAWCIPAFDAMAFGKTPIVTNWSGFTDYMTEDTGWLVDCYMQQAFGGNDSMYTGYESWAVVEIDYLRRCMREAYEDRQLREQKALAGKERAQEFSYNKIGNKLRKVLESYA
jgi:glycosyltransferase involved in cell wall biosynthesis